MEGGELFNRIQERADSAFTERGMYNIFFWSLEKNLVNDGSQLSNKFYQINKYFVTWWAVCSILNQSKRSKKFKNMLVLPQWNTLKFFGQWYYTVAENYDYVYRYMIKKHLKKTQQTNQMHMLLFLPDITCHPMWSVFIKEHILFPRHFPISSPEYNIDFWKITSFLFH